MKIVGVICTDVADIFYARAVSLLEEGLRRHNLDVMLSNTGEDRGRNSKYITDMTAKHVDAIITIGTPFSSEKDIRQLQQVAESDSGHYDQLRLSSAEHVQRRLQ